MTEIDEKPDLLRRLAARLPEGVDIALRAMPRFIIIGTQRGGTTSLYDHLTNHPRIRSAKRKEVHFFDNQYFKGIDWYRGQFPRIRFRPRMITGEATPHYLFHPEVPERIAAHLPGVRFIALLRDPIARAYSHFHMERKREREPLDFAAAVRTEQERLAGEAEKLTDPTYKSTERQNRSYVSRGFYAEQLERWFAVFPKERFLILRSEDLHADPAATLGRVLDFIGLEAATLGDYPHHNISQYADPVDAQTRSHLREVYRPHNDRLFELVGRDFGWNDPTV